MADLEKPDIETLRSPSTVELGISHPVNALQRFCNRLDAVCGVEARGIERIPEELRERDMALKDYIHMFTMYVSLPSDEVFRNARPVTFFWYCTDSSLVGSP